jgi:hypothetical protein
MTRVALLLNDGSHSAPFTLDDGKTTYELYGCGMQLGTVGAPRVWVASVYELTTDTCEAGGERVRLMKATRSHVRVASRAATGGASNGERAARGRVASSRITAIRGSH